MVGRDGTPASGPQVANALGPGGPLYLAACAALHARYAFCSTVGGALDAGRASSVGGSVGGDAPAIRIAGAAWVEDAVAAGSSELSIALWTKRF